MRFWIMKTINIHSVLRIYARRAHRKVWSRADLVKFCTEPGPAKELSRLKIELNRLASNRRCVLHLTVGSRAQMSPTCCVHHEELPQVISRLMKGSQKWHMLNSRFDGVLKELINAIVLSPTAQRQAPDSWPYWRVNVGITVITIGPA